MTRSTKVPFNEMINTDFEIAGIKGFGNPDLPFNLNSALSEMLDSKEVKKSINGGEYEEYAKFEEFALKVCNFLKENFQDKQKDPGKVLIQMGDVTKSEENTRLDFAVLMKSKDTAFKIISNLDKGKDDVNETILFQARTTQPQRPEQESQFGIHCLLSKESAALFADMLASNEFRKLGLVFKNLEKVNDFIKQFGSQDKKIPTLELKTTNSTGSLELKSSNNESLELKNSDVNTLQLKSKSIDKDIKADYKKVKNSI